MRRLTRTDEFDYDTYTYDNHFQANPAGIPLAPRVRLLLSQIEAKRRKSEAARAVFVRLIGRIAGTHDECVAATSHV